MVMYRIGNLVTNALRKYPKANNNDPTIATGRHPKRFTIGPI